MTIIEITDPRRVDAILHDRGYRVLEADAAASRPLGRFRAGVSRFVEGAVHAERRRRLEELLDGLDPDELAASAAALTRRELATGGEGTIGDRATQVARRVPVRCLAERLGFSETAALPELVAVVAAAYSTGSSSTGDSAGDDDARDAEADAAVERLLAAAGGAGDGCGPRDGSDAPLRLQLLVQAYAATAALIESAIRLAGTDEDATVSSTELIGRVLRDDPPVPLTRRIDENGTLLSLHLASGRDAARPLAFGAGSRGCPAPRHALAIAAAVIEELRAC